MAFLFAALYVQPGPFFDTLRHLNQSGIWIYLMNWLPIYLCAVMLHMLTNSCALAVSVTGAVAGSLSVANYLKIQMRHSPLFPWDLALVGEVLGIARSFPASLISMLIILFIGMLAFIALSVFFVRDKPLAVKRRIGGAVFVILASILMYGQYADKELYARAYVHGSPYNQVNRFNSRGFLYSFTHVLVGTRIEVPPGYSRQEAAAFLADCENIIQPRQTPHVIVIMSEAFSDIALNPGLDFTGFTDPLANFKEIKTESLSGHVVVPNIGGGTADMEFDFLTGVNTRHYRGVPYTFNLINKPIESLASKLTRIGYSSVMIHPGPGWFYDRANAYPHMGFDRTIFLPEFEGARYAGGYISEEAAIDKVISVFEEHIAVSNAPLFEFCITIQNHGPYLDKFLAPGDPPLPKNFETALPLSDASLNVLYNYFHGLTDADRELRRLTDYLEARP
ncbi:MAG: LTA synthase family protein, partial [Defluviitaleaceae bacterium]|nr:LTA synthase family protein [Defluviitaleaceae bacterium]